ncbi:hypothetical protein A9K65_013780 [Mesorhizobium sp. WSM1497]|uniref:hypothetical protein n=1 Tax=Mesorhizobium sp. WSM1497 TaxID=278153 RepID=UPI0007ECB432|nr:hypothetical protein [Mesorhizobium sp. WSM1497]ARP64331.1 hypothetical protein A9K65_013780 [Mesorhizobium sp. WSM1497]
MASLTYIEVAAHVVAAGIFDDKVRLTVVFTPVIPEVAPDQNPKYLENWPEVIDGLLSSDSAPRLLIQPLQDGESWRKYAANPKFLKLTRVGNSGNTAAIADYWRKIMGISDGTAKLKEALDPEDDPLDQMMRPSETKEISTKTPDIHGTARSKTAIEHSFERIRSLIGRLNNKVEKTREPTDAGESLSVKVAALLSQYPELKTGDSGGIKDGADMLEDLKAWDALKGSRQRADYFAEARRVFADVNTTPEDALKALKAGAMHNVWRPPLEAAMRAGALERVTDEKGNVQEKALGIEFAEASAAYRLASRTPPHADAAPLRLADEDPGVEYTRRRLFTIQSNPSLARLFRFVVDFTCELNGKTVNGTEVPGLSDVVKGGNAYMEESKVLDRDESEDVLIDGHAKALVDGAQLTSYFLLLSLADTFDGRRILTTAKCRLPGDSEDRKGHFYPCTREEIDAYATKCPEEQTEPAACSEYFRDVALAEQIDTIVDLGQKIESEGIVERRYDVMTLDPVTATGAEYSRQYSLKEIHKSVDEYTGQLPPGSMANLESLSAPANATQRGGGLAVGDRWRQWYNVLRHIDSADQRDTYKTSGETILDASDLTTGYKLDVGVRLQGDSANRNRWHTLMHRYVAYSPVGGTLSFAPSGLDRYLDGLYPDASARREADDGQVQLPTAMRNWEEQSRKIHFAELPYDLTSGFAEEIVGAWQGDPIGLSAGIEKQTLDPKAALQINMSYRLPSLNDPGKDPGALTPPSLRFGWRYHFGARSVYSGGVSMPLNRAFGHYEKRYGGDLILPAAPLAGHAFRRHERIDAPAITVPDWLFGKSIKDTFYTRVQLQGRFAVPQSGRMMVRSYDYLENLELVKLPKESGKQVVMPGVGFDRRILVAPAVSLEFATMHDAFRTKKGDSDFDLNVKMCEPRVPDEGSAQGDDEAALSELVPTSQGGEGRQVWKSIKVFWRSFKIRSRPKGGLRNIDYRASWGGFPIYRPASSAGAAEPRVDTDVQATPAPVDDAGQILHRTKSSGLFIFRDNANMRREILFGAVGVLANEKELPERSGTAVFRPLPPDRANDPERIPYYPDPAAISMMVSVEVRGDPEAAQLKEVKLYEGTTEWIPAAAGYPNVKPVVIDIVRGDRKKNPVQIVYKTYAQLPYTPAEYKGSQQIKVAHVTITLLPGEEADIRCWCVPSVAHLAFMSALIETFGIAAIAKARDKEKGLALTDAFMAGAAELVPAFAQELQRGVASSRSDDARPPVVGLGGLPAPGDATNVWLATLIRAVLLKWPLPEIAAVTEIEAVHAVDRPQEDAKGAQSGKPWALLRASADRIDEVLKRPPDEPVNWPLQDQMAGAVDVLIDGSITIHGPSTGAVEIRAYGAAAARGSFDDPDRGRTRDEQARGLWPRPDDVNYMNPKRLFGFDVQADGSVAFDQESVTLLRIEGFSPLTRQIDLLKTQREAATPAALPLRAQRPAAFPDARSRYIRLFAVAVSRHAGSLRTRYDEVPEKLDRIATEDNKPSGKPIALKEFWLPATIGPPRIVPRSAIPSFVWQDHTLIATGEAAPAAKVPLVYATRSTRVRIRLKRPWFVTGQGERLGIVIWPPNLFDLDSARVRNDLIKPPPQDREEIDLRKLPDDGSGLRYLQDADLGPGGQWVTRWGADPIRSLSQVDGWFLSKDNFPVEKVDGTQDYFAQAPDKISPDAVLVTNVLMPVPLDDDARNTADATPAGGFMAVSLITFAPRFDPEQEEWYVDVEIDPCDAIFPFVRLGLVRYQPNAPRPLQVSEPVVEWIQLMPDRKVSARAIRKRIHGVDKVFITATVEGAFSQPDPKGQNTDKSTERAPLMRLALLRRQAPLSGELLGSEVRFGEEQTPTPTCSGACMSWTAPFVVPLADYGQKGEAWTVYAEEVDRLRPARYGDEPRYQTRLDDAFAETGPRFTARLPLESLEVVKG